MIDDLFGWEKPRTEPRPKLSPDAARKQKYEARIARGLHPFGLKLREPSGETCGSCKHLCRKRMAKVYLKCSLRGDTNGPGTDVRVRWPACEKWEARP